MSKDMESLALERLKPRALELYQQQLIDRPLRDEYRRYFLQLFGPEALEALSDEELLTQIPQNIKNQGMDYTLEFKNDEEFNHRFFGSISGSYSKPYGVFRRRATGEWWTKEVEPATEEQARAVVKSRIVEVLAACSFLDSLSGVAVGELAPDKFQKDIAALAPRWHGTSWFHKYLHIYSPRLITWNHAKGHLEAELYRLGQPAYYNDQRYANDILALRFWSKLLEEPWCDVTPQWEKGSRDYWSFEVQSEKQARDVVKSGRLALAVSGLGDLSEAYQFSRIGEVEKAVRAEFQAQHVDSDLTTWKYFGFMKPGELVSLVYKNNVVVAVGELEEPGYEYLPSQECPHQRRIRWLHDTPFELDVGVESGLRWMSFKRGGLNVPLVERSILAFCNGSWPEIEPSLNLTASTGERITSSRVETSSSDPIIQDLLKMLRKKGQVILYGPPGTGKTWYAMKAAQEMLRQNEGAAEEWLATCTFHPAYGYEDFIEGYRPTGEGGFELRDGIFKRLALTAKENPNHDYVLLIDEINRGNIPKILGELITLLEYNKRDKLQLKLPVSGQTFTVPRNLYVVATMNTADRSILLLDTALRRRFGFMELMPQPERLQGTNLERPNLPLWLTAVNRRIVSALGRDGRNLQLGHAYLMEDGKPLQTFDQFSTALRQELWPLLQEYCYEDARALTAILGRAPKGLYDVESDDLAWWLFHPGKKESLLQALESLIEPEDTESLILEEEPHGLEDEESVV